MSIDQMHMAFPRLVGAPAYARPPAIVLPTDRPFDPDELPLTVDQTPEERAIAEALTRRADSTDLGFATDFAHPPGGRTASISSVPKASLAARSLSLRGFTSRIRGRS